MRWFIAVMVSLALVCSAAMAQSGRPDELQFLPLEFTIDYPEKFRLSNGIEVYFKQDSELPLLDVTVVVEAGKVGVPNIKAGLASLHADLLRSGGAGSWNAEQLDQRLEDLAANLKVEASSYTTRFDLSLLSEDAEDGLLILAAVVRQPRFDEHRFEVKRQQMLDKIRRRGDHPNALAQQLLLSRLYQGHSLAQFATTQTVTQLNLADLKQFNQRHMAPSSTRIVLTGAIDRAQAQQLLEQAFGDWAAAGELPLVAPFADSDPTGILLVDRPLPQTTVLLGEIGIEKSNPDLYAVQVMNYILGGGGFNSRLMQQIRSNRGLAYSVYSYYSVGRRLLGPFVAGCETKNDSVVEVVGLFRQLMNQMRQQPVSDAELTLAKESLINSFVFAFDDSHALANRILSQELYGYPADYLERYRERIAAVTAADVQRVARTYLNPERQLLVLVGDRETLLPSLEQLGDAVEEVPLKRLL